MASKTLRESRSFAGYGAAHIDGALRWDGCDAPGLYSARPDGAEVNPGEQSRYGNLKQNLTNHWQVQDR